MFLKGAMLRHKQLTVRIRTAVYNTHDAPESCNTKAYQLMVGMQSSRTVQCFVSNNVYRNPNCSMMLQKDSMLRLKQFMVGAQIAE